MLEQEKFGVHKNQENIDETFGSLSEMSGLNFDEHKYYHAQESTTDLLETAKHSQDAIR